MNLKKNLSNIFFATLLLSSCLLLAQDNMNFNRCATDIYNAELLQNNPNMMGSKAYEIIIAKQIQFNKKNRKRSRRVVYTIPVVVHVIHSGEAIGVGANISDAQIQSQIQVLNEDFRRMMGTRGHNSHVDGADVEIEFCLAKQTPDGCATNGIDRIDMSSVSSSWDGPQVNGNTQTQLKPATIWDPSKYMNVWTVNFSISSLLGYAQFPGTLTPNTDGVVCGYQYFGSNDDPNVTLTGNNNLGRTMTHEVGHYLGLYHTFQGGCAETDGGDLCGDTPAVADPSPNTDVCVSNNSCPAGDDDMIENYMDYSTDACMNIFTNDQKDRMVATITTASNRPTTLSSSVCNALASVNDDGDVKLKEINATNCSENFVPTIRITNWGTTTLTTATIVCDVDGGSSFNYNWSGSLDYGEFEIVNLPEQSTSTGGHTFNVTMTNPNGNADSRSCNNNANLGFNIDSYNAINSTTQVHLTLTPDNSGNEITWEFRDGSGGLIDSGGPYPPNDMTVINESFNVSTNSCYKFTINDSFGDGICCGDGAGSYQLKIDDDTVIVSGGSYTFTEVTNISTTPLLSTNDYFVNYKIAVYPNPVNNALYVKLANGVDLPDSFKVYNLMGQLVAEKLITSESHLMIDASSLSNGMYFVKVIKEGRSVSVPFIKE